MRVVLSARRPMWTSVEVLLSSTIASVVGLSSSYVSASPFHASSIVSTVNLGGSLTTTFTSYTLNYQPHADSGGSHEKDSHWTVGVEGRPGFVEARIGRGPHKQKALLDVEEVKSSVGQEGLTFYAITVPKPTDESAQTVVTLETVTAHLNKPFEESRPQVTEGVRMQWSSDISHLLAGLDPADVTALESIKIKVVCPTPRINEVKTPPLFDESHPQGGATVTFTSKGAPNDIVVPSSAPQIASVVYQLSEAIPSVRKLERIVEVSHWGAKASFQDNIDLYNPGPKLQGHFSRLEHQRLMMQNRAKTNSITDLSIQLPAGATNAYYYDLVGNVSTSNFRPSPPLTLTQKSKGKAPAPALLELKPRYPLQGGWNYSFTIGFDVPLSDSVKALKRNDGKRTFLLAVPFVTPLKDVAMDDVTVEIRLPEGASDIKVTPPFPVDSLTIDALSKGYLDSTGRPTVRLYKRSCSDRHSSPIFVEYTLPLYRDLLQKPLSVAMVMLTVFVLTLIARRTEWAIPK
ncbi:BZ3500_MvSof-1268-A1-R1_Chr11-2g03341 [Microbotryum saponariae]|uniref:Dolichyl-diphosphooligosaccharide--protein glycosyltransferase subunit 1 n=1 Tax=Microbotryum saponariae TaxID=289078 RepID=A0A2X0N7D2_9BASI|nr:BZ3500_MvSof-1268-A1-R1_Chr11-2g03341 [Microbotryum saponariae]SDA03162.1 BZ3501_MvSof-1269-A2-R1_Chr11g02912 [Microbotryum saponariae]